MKKISRRGFLKAGAVLAAGFVAGWKIRSVVRDKKRALSWAGHLAETVPYEDRGLAGHREFVQAHAKMMLNANPGRFGQKLDGETFRRYVLPYRANPWQVMEPFDGIQKEAMKITSGAKTVPDACAKLRSYLQDNFDHIDISATNRHS